MRAARDDIKPRNPTRRKTQVFPINLRLTEAQDAAIRARGDRRGITASAACRELISLGLAMESIEAGGLYVTRKAHRFIGQGGAKLTFVSHLSPTHLSFLEDDGNEWDEDDRDRLAAGAVLLCTVEEADNLQSFA